MPAHSSFARIKHLILKLQRADNAVKRRWFFGGTTISFVIVFVLWISYVSLAILPLSEKASSDTEGSFGSTFKTGIENLTNDLGKKYDAFKKNLDASIQTIEKKVTETNTITINGTDTAPFVPVPLENIPKTPLP